MGHRAALKNCREEKPEDDENKKKQLTGTKESPRINRKKMKGVQKLFFRPPNYEELRKKILGE